MADTNTSNSQTPAPPAPVPIAPAAKPERINNRLTRHGMEKAIRSGGSVLHNGTIISSVDKLPTEAELANGDTAAEEAARAGIEERQAALDRERAILDARRKAGNQQQPAKK